MLESKDLASVSSFDELAPITSLVGTTIAFKGSFGNAGGQGVVIGYSYNLQGALCVRIEGGKLVNRRNIIA